MGGPALEVVGGGQGSCPEGWKLSYKGGNYVHIGPRLLACLSSSTGP